jgi:hypothetical protein
MESPSTRSSALVRGFFPRLVAGHFLPSHGNFFLQKSFFWSSNGIVNLWEPRPSAGVAVGRLLLILALCGYDRAHDLLPALESLGHDVAIVEGGEPVAPRAEVFSRGTISGEELLCVPGALQLAMRGSRWRAG